MPGTDSSPSPTIFETRQKVDGFNIAQALLGANASVLSDILLVEGHSSIKILARSDVAGTVEVYQSVTNPAGGPTFVLTESKAATVDPKTGEFVVFLDSIVYGEFARIVYVNGATPQAKFEMSAYAIPVSSGPSTGGTTSAAEPCTKVFCYLSFS